MKVERLEKLVDVEYKLERITGTSLDYYEIEGISQVVEWQEENRAEPQPAELALESDIRFREDVICAKRGEKGKGKVWKKRMKDQQYRDMKDLQRRTQG